MEMFVEILFANGEGFRVLRSYDEADPDFTPQFGMWVAPFPNEAGNRFAHGMLETLAQSDEYGSVYATYVERSEPLVFSAISDDDSDALEVINQLRAMAGTYIGPNETGNIFEGGLDDLHDAGYDAGGHVWT